MQPTTRTGNLNNEESPLFNDSHFTQERISDHIRLTLAYSTHTHEVQDSKEVASCPRKGYSTDSLTTTNVPKVSKTSKYTTTTTTTTNDCISTNDTFNSLLDNNTISRKHLRVLKMPSSVFTHRFSSIIITIIMVMFLLLSNGIPGTEAIEWLAVAKRRETHWNRTSDCRAPGLEGLTRYQQKFCARHLDLMVAVVHASLQTAQVCQELFIDNRWNCSSILLAPEFMFDLTQGSREQAVVYALASASLTQSIAKTCSSGYSTKCSCNRQPINEPTATDFKWGGCGDDVRFAVSFAQSFTDQVWLKNKDRSKKAMVNLHNNRVGREMMAASLGTACKCHGVSGSCSMKTCWKALPDLKAIGAELLKKYSVAVEVQMKKVLAEEQKKTSKNIGYVNDIETSSTDEFQHVDYGGEEPFREIIVAKTPANDEAKSQPKKAKKILIPILSFKKNYSENDLLFVAKSPDYCKYQPTLGSIGTKGRECQKDENGSGGCKSMCCGRGYISDTVDIQYRCDCKYYWCCYVKCKVCSKTVEISRCR